MGISMTGMFCRVTLCFDESAYDRDATGVAPQVFLTLCIYCITHNKPYATLQIAPKMIVNI